MKTLLILTVLTFSMGCKTTANCGNYEPECKDPKTVRQCADNADHCRVCACVANPGADLQSTPTQ